MTEKPKRKVSDIPSKKSGCILSSVWFIVVVLLCISASGYIYLRIGQIFFGHPVLQTECELVVTDAIRLRIESYVCLTCGHPRHHRISHDAGETWTTVYTHLNSDDGVIAADCSEFQILSPEKFYFMPTTYHESYFFATNDSGEKWHQWRPSDIAEYPDGFRCYHIIDVDFNNVNNGVMQLDCSRNQQQSYQHQDINLFTDNSGITWNIAND